MVKRSIQPVVCAVATVTRGREFGGDVIRICRACVLCRVAGIALGRHRLELAVGHTLVAGVAIHRSMGPGQREPVVVLLNLLDRDLPPAHGMALLAVGPQLTPVNIGVAVLAPLPNA